MAATMIYTTRSIKRGSGGTRALSIDQDLTLLMLWGSKIIKMGLRRQEATISRTTAPILSIIML
jgi:hypothetical protein